MTRYRFDYLYRPGRTLAEPALHELSREISALGARCLEPLPDYQVFLGTRDAFADKIVTTARDSDGTLVAFCSCVLLPMQAGEVLHLGLTCVAPELRGSRLSSTLAQRLITRYYVTQKLYRRLWMTSVACVLSVLGNVACRFRRVYPTPWQLRPFSSDVDAIASEFDRRFRHVAYVRPDATFDRETFVFRGSGRGTAFQKEAEAVEFHHRDPALNEFYKRRLRFEDGDELLQIACFDLLDVVRYPIDDLLAIGRRRASQRTGGHA
ncbi:MAG TPA: GNAT family N-acetyltransferase [Kofleriaceae bacterium]